MLLAGVVLGRLVAAFALLWMERRGPPAYPGSCGLQWRVFFRINTRRRWREFSRLFDFKIELLEFYNVPSVWFLKIPSLYWLNEAIHFVTRLPFLGAFRSSMLVVARFHPTSNWHERETGSSSCEISARCAPGRCEPG